jgi:orotidine-5'-phosphate decarboxylase
MQNFADRLIEAVEDKRSCVVVGLDPHIESFPEDIRKDIGASSAEAAQAILKFNRQVISVIAEHAVAVKPQSAFYEALGWEGVRAYAETIKIAHEHDLLVIADVKRGDIGSTAEAYAKAHLDHFGADAVTVNPYLGTDSIQPFIKRTGAGKGIFVLVKTSNPSSTDIQDLDSGNRKVYEHVADLVERWGATCRGASGYSAVGAVVGATFPDIAAGLRRVMPHAIFLLPGYGAQGATAEDCKSCFDADGRGAIVSSSRGIIYAHTKAEKPGFSWDAYVAQAAGRMRQELEAVRCGS